MKTSRTAIITFIAFVLSLVGTVANAATYYVSTSGSDSNNCTSETEYWFNYRLDNGNTAAGTIRITQEAAQ